MKITLVSVLVVLVVGCVMVDQTDAWFRRAVRSVGNWGRRKVVDPVGRWGRRIRVLKRTNGGDDGLTVNGECDLACFLAENGDDFSSAAEAVQTFNEIDADSNGYITQAELGAYLANTSDKRENTKRNLLSELEELKTALGDDDEK